MGEEERKQDCETKAFKRLAGKVKKAFPRLPIILLADSLYALEPVMEICRDNHWEFINDIDYKGNPVNMLRFWEEKISNGETVRTGFQWMTSIRITEKNVEKTSGADRKRWKIANEGFNRQKN